MATKRARVTPTRVIQLQRLIWDGQAGGATSSMPTIHEVKFLSKFGSVYLLLDDVRTTAVTTRVVEGHVQLWCGWARVNAFVVKVETAND